MPRKLLTIAVLATASALSLTPVLAATRSQIPEPAQHQSEQPEQPQSPQGGDQKEVKAGEDVSAGIKKLNPTPRPAPEQPETHVAPTNTPANPLGIAPRPVSYPEDSHNPEREAPEVVHQKLTQLHSDPAARASAAKELQALPDAERCQQVSTNLTNRITFYQTNFTNQSTRYQALVENLNAAEMHLASLGVSTTTLITDITYIETQQAAISNLFNQLIGDIQTAIPHACDPDKTVFKSLVSTINSDVTQLRTASDALKNFAQNQLKTDLQALDNSANPQ